MVLASRLTQLLNFDVDVGEKVWCERPLRDRRVVSPTFNRMHHYPPVKIISRPLTTNHQFLKPSNPKAAILVM